MAFTQGSRGKFCQGPHYAIIRTKTRGGRGRGALPGHKNSIWFASFVGVRGLSDVQNIDEDKSPEPSIFYEQFYMVLLGPWIQILSRVSNIFPFSANKIPDWYKMETRLNIPFSGIADADFRTLCLDIGVIPQFHLNPG